MISKMQICHPSSAFTFLRIYLPDDVDPLATMAGSVNDLLMFSAANQRLTYSVPNGDAFIRSIKCSSE